MFRALSFPETGADSKITMEAPISVQLLAEDKDAKHPSISLALKSGDVFTTAVGHATKRTLAAWHVTSPQEVVEELLSLGKSSEEAKL